MATWASLKLSHRTAPSAESCAQRADEGGAYIHPATAEVYRKQVASAHDALADAGTRDEAFEIIRSLIEEICLVPEAGALKIELRGELAGILALASESTKARGLSTTGLAEQIKLVAGTRNRLCRTQVGKV